MAFAGFGEVTDVHTAVGAVRQRDAHEPRVSRAHHVRRVAGGVAAAVAREAVVIDAATVDVVHKDIAAIFDRPIVAEVNHRATVGVAASCHVLLRRADAGADGLGIREMQMIRDGRDALVGKPPRRPVAVGLVMRTLDDLKQMWVHAIAHEGVAVLVPVYPPRVGRADGERLPLVPHRMIPPHPTLEPPPLGLRRPRLAGQRPVRDPVRAVQPPIRPPSKTVGDGVRVGVRAKAVEQHHRLPIRHAIVVGIRDEIKIRNRHYPRPAKPDLNPAHVFQFVVKHDALIVPPIPIRILQDNNPVPLPSLLVRIIIRLRDPQPSPVINAKPNRLPNIRLPGKKCHLEPLRHLHRPRRLQWRERLLNDRLRVSFRTPKIDRCQ